MRAEFVAYAGYKSIARSVKQCDHIKKALYHLCNLSSKLGKSRVINLGAQNQDRKYSFK